MKSKNNLTCTGDKNSRQKEALNRKVKSLNFPQARRDGYLARFLQKTEDK